MSPSKISRLPHAIREELNRRMDQSEPGHSILKWLNALPETLAVLAREFDARPISKQNLNDWKKSGFRHWQLRRAALQFVAETDDLPALQHSITPPPPPPGSNPSTPSFSDSIANKLANWVALRYAAIAQSLPPPDGDPQSELRSLNDLCLSVVALRRGDLHAQRVRLENKRLQLLDSTAEQQREKLFWEWTARPEIQAKLYPKPDRDQRRREAERVLDFKMLGIPYDPPTSPLADQPADQPDESADPAILI